jgi:hypothetical protein
MSEQKALLVLQKDIDGLALRIRDLMPGGNKLTLPESLALAQVALIHGLDPFNGELWYLKKKDGTPIGLMAGIKGHRRAARVQIEREGGGAHWCEFDLLTKEEKAALFIPDNALAFRCRLFDSINLRTYSEAVERLMKSNVPWDDVKAMLGARPYNVGYGYFTPGEPTLMKPGACAMKRSEADALKRRFDLPFGDGVGQSRDQDDDHADAIDAEYKITGPTDPETVTAKREAVGAALYGSDPDLPMGGDIGPDLGALKQYDSTLGTTSALGTTPDQARAISVPNEIKLIMTQIENQGGRLYMDEGNHLRMGGPITDTLKEKIKANAGALVEAMSVQVPF